MFVGWFIPLPPSMDRSIERQGQAGLFPSILFSISTMYVLCYHVALHRMKMKMKMKGNNDNDKDNDHDKDKDDDN